MKKRFQHIYLEITNICNLDCSFCPKHSRSLAYMNREDFIQILQSISLYTDMVYFHLMGEPLLHPNFAEYLEIANQMGFKVGITTNGVFLKDHIDDFAGKKIARIQISLHSYYDSHNRIPFTKVEEVMWACDEILKKCETTIFYRLWNVEDPEAIIIMNQLKEHYPFDFTIEQVQTAPNGIRLDHRVRLQLASLFEWPIRAHKEDTKGFCQGLRTHVGIHVNGDVVPCCLDSEGIIRLGNIHMTPFEEIIESPLAKEIYNGFSNRKVVHSLCQKCSYKERFSK